MRIQTTGTSKMDSASNNVSEDINSFNQKAKEAKQIFKALERQMYLPEVGTFGDVFQTLTNNTLWLCKLCNCTLSRSEMASHTQDSKHQFLNKQHKVIYKEYYETKPVMMEEAKADPTTNYELLKALNRFKDEPLLGVEYILEIVFKNKKRCKFICTLCSNMKCAPVEHLSGTFHTMMYVKTHFKTAHKHFGTNKLSKLKKEHKLVLTKLARAIETTYGRLKPYQINTPEHFAYGKTIRAVKRGQHFSESDGQTFEDLVVKELARVLPKSPSNMVDNEVSSTQDQPSITVNKMDQHSIKNEVDDKSQLPTVDLHNEEGIKGGHIELLAERKDPSAYDYKQEWKEIGDENILKVPNEEIQSNNEAKEMLGLLDEPISVSSSPVININEEVVLLDDNDEDYQNYTRKRNESLSSMSIDSSQRSHTNIVLPTRRKDSPPRHRNSPSRIRYSPSPLRYSPFRLRDSSSRNRDSPFHRRYSYSCCRYYPSRCRYSPSRIRYSPSRIRYSPSRIRYSPSPLRYSPFHHRNSPSPRRYSPFRRIYSSSRRRDSPFGRRYSPCRRRVSVFHRRDSPSQRRDSPYRRRDFPFRRRYSRSRSRDSSLRARISPLRRREFPRRRNTPSRRRDTPSRRRDKKKSDRPMILTDKLDRRLRGIGESSEIPLKRKRDSHDKRSDSSEDIEINFVVILGKLATLEEELGSLGPKVIGLVSNALAMENEKLNSSEDLLNNEDNYVLFKTVVEKLKGLLESGSLDKARKKEFKKIKRNAKSLLKRFKRKKLSKEHKEWDNVHVLPVGIVDKENISMQTISTLLAQGKSDIVLEELDEMIRVLENGGGLQSTTDCSTNLESYQKKPASRDTNEENLYNPSSIPQSTSEENNDLSRLEEKRMVELKKLEDTRLLINSLMDNQQNSLSNFSKTDNEVLTNPSTNISGPYIQGYNNQQFLRSVLLSHKAEQNVNMGGFINLLKNNYRYISNFQKPSSRQRGNLNDQSEPY